MFEKLCDEVITKYRERGWKIVTAESCTGGLLSGALTQIAGSSDVFDRGFVTYSYSSKTDLLGVSTKLLEDVGAVSVEVAEAMATGALKASAADVAVSITGVAGPGASEHKPEGMVCFGFAALDERTETVEHQFGALGRAKVREASVKRALDLLLSQLNNQTHIN